MLKTSAKRQMIDNVLAEDNTSMDAQLLRQLRIAAYLHPETLLKLESFCAEHNKTRNDSLNYILRVMLNVDDGTEESELYRNIAMFEGLLKKIENSTAPA